MIDATAGIRLYRKYRKEWERTIRTGIVTPIPELERPQQHASPRQYGADIGNAGAGDRHGDGAAGTGEHDFFSSVRTGKKDAKGKSKSKSLPMSNLVM